MTKSNRNETESWGALMATIQVKYLKSMAIQRQVGRGKQSHYLTPRTISLHYKEHIDCVLSIRVGTLIWYSRTCPH